MSNKFQPVRDHRRRQFVIDTADERIVFTAHAVTTGIGTDQHEVQFADIEDFRRIPRERTDS